MSKLRNWIGRLRDEQGATLVLVALGISVFLGMVALAVDLGMLLGARTESQRVADAAALAGAASYLTDPTNVDRPREWAIEYAALNTVHGQTAVLQDQDVDVLLDEQKVRVRVYNVETRGNAIATIFGRVLGWQSRDVSTVAAAEAYPATQTKLCPIPIALPDRWLDGNDDGVFTGTGSDPDLYVPFDPVEYEEFGTTQIAAWGGFGDFTGYYHYNIGDIIEIKTASNAVNEGEEASPCVETESWRCWFQPLATNGAEMPDDIGGNDALRPWIWGCPEGEEAPIGIGDWVYESSGGGDKQTLLHKDFVDVMNLEPNLMWSGTCVVDDFDMSEECACVFLEQVGLYYVPGSTQITPFKAKKGNWNLYIRLIPCAGMGPSAGDGTIVKALRLVRY